MVTHLPLGSRTFSPRSHGRGLRSAWPAIRQTWRNYASAGSATVSRQYPIHDLRLHRGRFSEGQEVLGDDDPEKHIRRRFSEGVETRRPTG